MNTPHAIAALIHDRLGRTLSDVFAANGTTGDIFSIRLEPGDTLLASWRRPTMVHRESPSSWSWTSSTVPSRRCRMSSSGACERLVSSCGTRATF
jgi:hypothetical protein